ncbi:MAG: hypothetical protein HKN47_10535 [Pirellulaceae bacterium]|nr:hypothetical protein [Pirellulaceae bacterium]
MLFIGNSYTARHRLAEVVKSMAEAGDPGLNFQYETVIYGGRTLADHWRLRTQNFVRRHSLTRDEQTATIASMKKSALTDANDRYAKAALQKHRSFLEDLDSNRKRWDVIVLQSYRDDLDGSESLYAQYAPKFAQLAAQQGARTILYVTTPTTQNAQPLKKSPNRDAVLDKSRAIAALADQVDASVAPMALVASICQSERPDLTLRFVNDAHLNQTMAYLTACTLYAALFDKSPQGLPIDSITDIRYLDNDPKQKDKDRDGKPITRTFSKQDKDDLQRFAWQGYQAFQALRSDLRTR